MTDNTENIDNIFKTNIDKIDVQYNAAHWDKLQKSLLVAGAVGVTAAATTTKWQAILKFLKLYKLFFIGIPSVAIVTTSVMYFSKTDPELEAAFPILKDSTGQELAPPVLPDTQLPQPVNNLFYTQPTIQSDSSLYINPYQIDTTKKLLPVKKDSVIGAKNDTVPKKKNVNVFW